MPKSKTAPRRAKKLESRRAANARNVQPMSYVEMLDRLRETLNARFYEEQGFPHLEILAANYKGPVTTGDLSDYMQLQHFFIGMTVALAHAVSSSSRMTMEQREDSCAAVAYAIAATLLDLREDFRDTSGWMGRQALDAVRARWGMAKMYQAGIEDAARQMDDRSLASYFGMDFVMTLLDMTGELAQRGSDSVISVTTCKDEVITAFTSYATANQALAGSRLVDLDKIFAENAVTDEFHKDYPNWRPEPADALNPALLGFNALSDEDTAYLEKLIRDPHFLHDMRVLYVRTPAEEIPQGKREEVVMGYALRYGPRSTKAFEAGRDPTEAEMDQDAEVINLLVMTVFLQADAITVAGIDDDPKNEEEIDRDSHTYQVTMDSQVQKVFDTWKNTKLVPGAAPVPEAQA